MLIYKSHGGVVQLVRMPACHAGGRGFESLRLRRKKIIMLSFIRDKLKSWIVIILVILVAIPLIFLGVGDYGTNQEQYASQGQRSGDK